MTETPEQIEARIRTPQQFVVTDNEYHIIVTPDEFPAWYEEMVDERVGWAMAQQTAEALHAAKEQKAQQFGTGMATLRTNLEFLTNPATTTLTNAQIKKGLTDIHRSLIWLGETLRDYAVFTWDE